MRIGMKLLRRPLSAGIVLIGVSGCGGGGSESITEVPALTASSLCASVSGKTIGNAVVTNTTVIAGAGSVPAYCEVTAHIDPALNFRLRLPEGWNGKLYYEGGGGFDGIIPAVNQNALQKGFANVSSDGGHTGAGTTALAAGADGSWAINNPVGIEMFASLSVPTVMGAATKMVQTSYGTAPAKSYFEGCSNGGREALMAAERYPQLFDGIIARAPAYNWTGMFGAFNTNAKAVAALSTPMTSAKVATLAKAVRSACDAGDGVVDGVISNPSACKFDPQVLRCTGGADSGPDCLSDSQLTLVKTWTSSLAFNNGAYRNAGYPLSGNEDDPSAWTGYLLGAGGNLRSSYTYLLQDNYVKYFLARDPAADSLKYVWDQDAGVLAQLASSLDVVPDLRGFAQNGGKLLLWHGSADAAISVTGTTEYFNSVNQTLGTAAANSTIRYYIAPGVAHCGGGPGASSVDYLAAMDSWRQSGTAPETLQASKVSNGLTVLSRPLCRYPMYPKYSGPTGDSNAATLASNFVCAMP